MSAISDFVSRFALYVYAACLVGGLYFGWQAYQSWRTSRKAFFGVERDMARVEIIGYLYRLFGLALLALLVFGLSSLGGGEAAGEGQAQPPAPTSGAPVQQGTATLPPPVVIEATNTPAAPSTPEVTPVAPQPTPTAGPPPPVSPTPTRVPTGVVTGTAGGGLWLRAAPGFSGETLIVLPEGTVVQLLEGQQEVDGTLWQQVRTEDGREGWVAASYLQINP